MLWTTGVILAALAFSQVSAGLVDSEVVYNENVIDGESIASERIGSGWVASPGQFPFMVRVQYFGTSSRNCGGSIIHNNWVLSGAFCPTIVNRTHARVIAGVTSLSSTPQHNSETREWWIHPLFDVTLPRTVQSYDICILRLQQPLIYTPLVQPIRIESSSDAFRDYTNEVFTTMGWGRVAQTASSPNVLNWVYLRGISSQDCHLSWPTSTDYHICAAGLNNSAQSTCPNDDGGPLIRIGQAEEPVLVGIIGVWLGSTPCGNGRPSGFNRISPFHDWLTNVTGVEFDEATEPPTTEATEPPTTEVTEPPTTEATEPPTTEATEPPTTEATEPPTTEATEPPTTEATEPPTTKATEPPTTEATEPDSEETDKDSNESDSSESEEDPETSELLNKLLVKVKVKVKMNSIIKKNVTHSH